MNIPHDAILQNCINGSAAPNRRTAKAPDKKSFKRYHLNHWPKFKEKITELFLMMHPTKILQMVPLHWSVILRWETQGPRALLFLYCDDFDELFQKCHM